MLVAVDGQTGAPAGERAIAASDAGALDALRFAAGLGGDERVWAIEDCRHVSARLETALIAAGERVIRVPAAITGRTRKVSRQAGSLIRSTPALSRWPWCATGSKASPWHSPMSTRWRSAFCRTIGIRSSASALG